MTIYWLLYIIVLFSEIVRKRSKKISDFVAFITIFIIMGFRAVSVGVDTAQYLYRYDNLHSIFFGGTSQAEFGYHYFSMFFRDILGVNYHVYLAVTSAIIVWITFAFLKNNSDNLFVSIVMYISLGLFTFNMSGIRQSLAIVLIFLAIRCIERRELLRFVFLVLIASTLHQSAIIFLPVYFIYGLRLCKKRSVVLMSIMLALYFVGSVLMPLVAKLAPSKYAAFDLQQAYNINILVIAFPVLIFFFSIIFMKTERDRRFSVRDTFYIMLFCAYVGFFTLSVNNNLISRLAYYFYPGMYIIMPRAIEEMKRKKLEQGVIVEAVFVVACVAYFMISTPGGIMKIDNYSFFK